MFALDLRKPFNRRSAIFPALALLACSGAKGAEPVRVVEPKGTREVSNQGPLFLGETLETGPDQSVAVLLQDHTEINVGPASDLTVRSLKPMQIELTGGVLHLLVPKGIYGTKRDFTCKRRWPRWAFEVRNFWRSSPPGAAASGSAACEQPIGIACILNNI